MSRLVVTLGKAVNGKNAIEKINYYLLRVMLVA
jgi:hypothetical protein